MMTFAARTPRALGLVLLVSLASTGPAAQAQEKVAAPAGQIGLEECLEIALRQQPALAAARASLAAAQSGQQAVQNLPFGPALRIRREQACLGVSIAAAGLQQAEWETRYAVRRTFYSVQFAREQKKVVDGAVGKIEEAHRQATKLVQAGDPKIQITQIDVDTLAVAKKLVETKQAQAKVGIQKAIAGLREAMGVGLDFPLDVAETPLPAAVTDLDKQTLISQARANRGELEQAIHFLRITELEVTAQKRNLLGFQVKTFAAGADLHVKPIPQGEANGEYRPGAIGPEMPTHMIGGRSDRVQRAEDLTARSVAVLDKTENLITLEVEATYLKWDEARQNVQGLGLTPKMSRDIADKVRKRFNDGNATGQEYLQARTLEDQSQAMYNQALFDHALALAALERVTAGGYRIPQ